MWKSVIVALAYFAAVIGASAQGTVTQVQGGATYSGGGQVNVGDQLTASDTITTGQGGSVEIGILDEAGNIIETVSVPPNTALEFTVAANGTISFAAPAAAAAATPGLAGILVAGGVAAGAVVLGVADDNDSN